jgi:hypothetical protein
VLRTRARALTHGAAGNAVVYLLVFQPVKLPV